MFLDSDTEPFPPILIDRRQLRLTTPQNAPHS